jgi:selenocysteine lyase/cysteine desulfurase
VNWARTRSFFPVTRQLAYLDNAGVAPISTRVEEALARFAGEASQRGAQHYDDFYDAEIERVRGRAARLLGARPEEIAFVKNTTEGLGLVAVGLDWRPGDQVVSCDLEYPSNVYPWWSLRQRGVETVMLRGRDGSLPLDSVERALASPRTRLLALSSVEFGSGARNDLEALGKLCRERGVLFCVDAIQSLGCLPLDAERCGIDFLAADGHKWLLSVEGCGIFYCSRRVIDLVTPRIVGWRNVADNRDFDRYHLDLQPGAGRFEEGTPNTAGIFALGAALDLLLELGVDAIGRRVLELSERLVEGLTQRGAQVLSPREPGQASGIVSFRLSEEPPGRSVERLRDRGVIVVARRGGVRASPHFYNDPADLDRLLGAL